MRHQLSAQLRLCTAFSAAIVATVGGAGTAAADLVDGPWDQFGDSHLDNDANGTGWAYDEILVNGHFETGDLSAWTIGNEAPAPEWAALSGSAGATAFGPADGGYFATPWTRGGWEARTASTLWQLADLPAEREDEALVRFEAYTAWDAIEFELDWFVSDDAGQLALLRSDDLGHYGERIGSGTDAYHQLLSIPEGATHALFRSRGVLTDGNWIDAGFDKASIVTARAIPEPTSVAVIAVAGALLATRRRRW